MPLGLIVFIVIQALAAGHSVLLESPQIYKGVDASSNSSGLSPTPITYRVWTSPRWEALSDYAKGCDMRLFMRVNGRGYMRARISGFEQLLDESWVKDYRINEGERANIQVQWIEPLTGEIARETSIVFHCAASFGRVIKPFTGE